MFRRFMDLVEANRQRQHERQMKRDRKILTALVATAGVLALVSGRNVKTLKIKL